MIRAADWLPSGGLGLEPNALLAAQELHLSLALTAGPGAGKTEMLAQRADFLLRTNASRYPMRILAISFKVDASRNLKERVRRRCGPQLASRLDSHTFHAFAKRLIDRFRPALIGHDALDPDYSIGDRQIFRRQIEFRDLVPLAIKILATCPLALSAVRQTYSHVFLDEFQDCTAEQYELIRVAFQGTGARLTAVGDTKQRIMGWAGALEGVFQTFAQDFDARPLNLYQNFRSAPRLRRMQNAMVKVMDPEAAAPDASMAGPGGEVAVWEFADSQQEAIALAERVQRWITTEGLAPSEIVILLSRQPDLYANLLIDEFKRRVIPYRDEQALQDLSGEPAALLIVDFLTVVLGDRKPLAFSRLLDAVLTFGVDDDLEDEERACLLRFLESARRQARNGRRRQLDVADVRATAEAFLHHIGRTIVAGFSPDYQNADYLERVIEQTFERLRELMSAELTATQALARFSDDSAVRIMTIHKSKGLEFDTVVILGVEEETFWGTAEAERSAYFVGISRAKRRLFLTVAGHRARPADARRWNEVRRPHAEFLWYAGVN